MDRCIPVHTVSSAMLEVAPKLVMEVEDAEAIIINDLTRIKVGTHDVIAQRILEEAVLVEEESTTGVLRDRHRCRPDSDSF